MSVKHENVQLLVAVSSGEEVTAKIIGSTVSGPLNDEEFSDDTYLLDSEPGIYVWQGTVTDCGNSALYDGDFRPARTDDLERFGMKSLESLPTPPGSFEHDSLIRCPRCGNQRRPGDHPSDDWDFLRGGGRREAECPHCHEKFKVEVFECYSLLSPPMLEPAPSLGGTEGKGEDA